MPSETRPPLEPWADRARQVFWGSWGLVPTLAVLESFGVIDRSGGPWFWVSVAVSVVWTVSLVVWAVGAHRRRRS